MATLTRTEVAAALRRAAVRATLAPSVHNTQPWRFVLEGEALQVHADPSRQLQVLDPTRRQLLISCGCAVFNARVSLAASGRPVSVERMPDPARPEYLARIRVDDRDPVERIGALDAVLELRRTNRRRFAPDPVPDQLTDTLVDAARAEGTVLHPIREPDDRIVTAVLSQRADRQQHADPAYRAELRAWTSDDPTRADGVPTLAVPHTEVDSHDDIPIRDFDVLARGQLPGETRSSVNQCLLLLGTASDTPAAWARAGEALQRVLLEVTRFGFAASPLTQVVELPNTRGALRRELRLATYPCVLLRVGRAPATPAPRRRRLVDMLSGA